MNEKLEISNKELEVSEDFNTLQLKYEADMAVMNERLVERTQASLRRYQELLNINRDLVSQTKRLREALDDASNWIAEAEMTMLRVTSGPPSAGVIEAFRRDQNGDVNIQRVISEALKYHAGEPVSNADELQPITRPISSVEYVVSDDYENVIINVATGEHIELSPCPFCGSKNISSSIGKRYERDQYYIECEDCAATSDFFDTVIESVEKWNSRKNTIPRTDVEPLVRALTEALSPHVHLEGCLSRENGPCQCGYRDRPKEVMKAMRDTLTTFTAKHGGLS